MSFADVFICGGYNGEVILADLWKLNLQTFQWSKLPAVMPEPAYFHCAAVTPVSTELSLLVTWLTLNLCSIKNHVLFNCPSLRLQAGCMYIHGGVVDIHENKRTGSLFKIWLVVPSLLELCWEKLLKAFPHMSSLPNLELLNLGLTQELIHRLKWVARWRANRHGLSWLDWMKRQHVSHNQNSLDFALLLRSQKKLHLKSKNNGVPFLLLLFITVCQNEEVGCQVPEVLPLWQCTRLSQPVIAKGLLFSTIFKTIVHRRTACLFIWRKKNIFEGGLITSHKTTLCTNRLANL